MIAATLSLEQASSRLWDAVVVGAGPAEALAAGELAGQGAATSFDRSGRLPTLESLRLLYQPVRWQRSRRSDWVI